MATRSRKTITKAKSVTGAAGVHFVGYRLSALGYIAALTPEGVPGVDLMAYSPKSTRAVSVQVKTATNAAQMKGKERRKDSHLYWPVSKNVLELRGKDVFYAFVDMKGCAEDRPRPQEAPDVFIVPSGWVANPRHRDIRNPKKLASLNTFRNSKGRESFFFNIYPRGQEKWAEKWELITDKLDKAL